MNSTFGEFIFEKKIEKKSLVKNRFKFRNSNRNRDRKT